MERYQEAAYNLAYRLLGDRERAADATQEAFLSAYLHLADLQGPSFRSWLLRIVANQCYDLLRRARVRAARSLEEMADQGLDPVEGGESPEEGALRSEQRLALERCLGTLPVDQRAVLVLSDIQGSSYQEIAAVLGLSAGTVKSRLSRARGKMRDCLTAAGAL